MGWIQTRTKLKNKSAESTDSSGGRCGLNTVLRLLCTDRQMAVVFCCCCLVLIKLCPPPPINFVRFVLPRQELPPARLTPSPTPSPTEIASECRGPGPPSPSPNRSKTATRRERTMPPLACAQPPKGNKRGVGWTAKNTGDVYK